MVAAEGATALEFLGDFLMNQVHCHHCGQSFRVRRADPKREYFCCAGCVLRARVPVDAAGNYPVTGELIAVLVVGVLYFNQLLTWGVGALLARQDKVLLAQRFSMAGVILALLVWLGLVLLQRRARPGQGKDYVITAVSFLFIAASLGSALPAGGLLAAANGMFLAWSLRGVFRRKVKDKP